ncbi:MAG TPA: peptide deformylase [Oscillospiraceae bacterium]|nr:peptide deformylase [Oscillospiraceae bacterium]
MALRQIRKNGDPALRQKAREVRKITPAITKLLNEMAETMYDAQGVGLAAPQVGISKRLVVIDVQDDRGLLKLINPKIIDRSGKETAIEGCLSFPGIAGEVERAAQVTVEALDETGTKITIEAEGLLARACQHEFDHLEGVLFVDRATRFIEQEE